MRTQSIVKKPTCIPFWLQALLISRKRVLDVHETALYLKTSTEYIYHLVCYYHLPSHKTKKRRLYFNRKELNDWLKAREMEEFPQCTRKPRTAAICLNNDL